MARSVVSLTEDVWTSLGTGEMIITLKGAGKSGHLLLNSAESIPEALIVTKDRLGHQFANTSAADEMFARPTAAGYRVVVDI